MSQFERVSNGATYKSKTDNHTLYTTINNDEDGNPIEIFVRINDKEYFEMITLVTRLTSMLLQSGTSPIIMAKELQDVYSPTTRHMIPKTNVMCPSIIARIGMILEDHINRT
jgi:hypothetical protein